MRVEASGGQAVELPDLPVEDPRGNEAAQGADASGEPARGVAQLRLRIGGGRDDRSGDDGRVIAVRLGGPGCAGACIVDQNVEPPEAVDDVPDGRADGSVARDIEVDEPDPSSGAMPDVFRLVPITSKPAWASATAAALPMPEDAPVTSATGLADVIGDSLALIS